MKRQQAHYSGNSHCGGFSLVELAMGLLIIGLLVVGVLQGQALLTNAKITRTIAQGNAYIKAVNSFENMYGALPGDFAHAQRDIPGCREAAQCMDGNGDGMVGGLDRPNEVLFARFIAVNDPETLEAWKHLALAELVEDIDVDFAGTDFKWGVSHPRNAFGGGVQFFSYYNNWPGIAHGVYFIFSRTVPEGGEGGSDGNSPYLLSPIIAQAIDLKADDGLPTEGRVRGAVWIPANIEATVDPCITPDLDYNTQLGMERRCMLYFRYSR